jgi:hypothetical protein
MRGNVVCPNSKVIRMDIVDEKVVTDLKNRHSNISFIEKYTKTEIKNNLQEFISLLTDTISNIEKLRYNHQLGNYDKINEKISSSISLLNDFNNEKMDTFERKTIQTKKEIIKKYISRIELSKNKIIITYPFPVNSKLSHSITYDI